MVELLAPAGTKEALLAAIESGANAIYLAGNMFGARAYADNFDEAGMREAIRLAHLRNVQIHVTVNTIVDDNELAALKKYLRFLAEAGADAVLVQDLGVARVVRETVPELPMHASTQMTVHNLDGVLALEKMGFSRVVLSRELTLEAIRHICANSHVEIETFVHGALCVCYSGQCLMSSVIGGRSGNRGRCAQPCRLPYTLVDERNNDLLGNTAGKYLLSPRDMKGIELLPQLLEAGVSSLKIEGRMKRPEYVAIVVGSYRRAIDSYLAGSFQVPAEDSKALTQIFNRDFTTAYLEKKQGRNMMSDKRPNNRGLMLGRVLDFDRDSRLVTIKLATELSVGDQVDFWVKVGGRVTTTIQQLQLVTGQQGAKKKSGGKGKQNAKAGINLQQLVPVESAEAGAVAAFQVEGWVYPGDRAFKVYDAALMEAAKAMYNSGAPVRRIPVQARVHAAVGEPLSIQMKDADGNQAQAATEYIGQEAMKRPLSKETVEKQISRLGTSIFTLTDLQTDIQGQVMVPVSEINEVRRQCVEQLEQARMHQYGVKAAQASKQARAALLAGKAQLAQETAAVRSKGTGITVVADNLAKTAAALQAGATTIVFGGESYSHEAITLPMYEKAVALAKAAGAKLIFNTPRIIRDAELPAFHKWLQAVDSYGGDGISVHNIGTYEAAREYTNLPIWADYSLISYNQETLQHFQELGLAGAVLSPELNFTQVEKLAAQSQLPLECLVEGNLELMVSEYCCTGSFLGGLDSGRCSAPCVNSGKRFFLKDRKDMKFPLVMDQFCHMHLLNGNRLSMLPHAMRFRELGLSAVRIDGRYMDEAGLKKTVKNYLTYMQHKGELDEAERKAAEQLEGSNITRGHYFRGVL